MFSVKIFFFILVYKISQNALCIIAVFIINDLSMHITIFLDTCALVNL